MTDDVEDHDLKVTVTTDEFGLPVAVTLTDAESRIHKVYWERPPLLPGPHVSEVNGDRYQMLVGSDNTWCEICDTKEPHANGVGNPIARVANKDVAEVMLLALNLDRLTQMKAKWLVRLHHMIPVGIVLRDRDRARRATIDMSNVKWNYD
jgi:hypothetical protein